MSRFERGRTLITREVWRGQVWAVRPMICVGDDDHLALWFPRGAPWLLPVSRAGGERIRVPTEPWDLHEATWHLNDNLILIRDGDAHAIHLFFGEDGEQLGWYVNLQEPVRRTHLGVDYMDNALDIVASPDLARIEWKDEDDFAEHAALVGDSEAAAIRAEGETVIERMNARAWPFDGTFDGFRPAVDARPSLTGFKVQAAYDAAGRATARRDYSVLGALLHPDVTVAAGPASLGRDALLAAIASEIDKAIDPVSIEMIVTRVEEGPAVVTADIREVTTYGIKDNGGRVRRLSYVQEFTDTLIDSGQGWQIVGSQIRPSDEMTLDGEPVTRDGLREIAAPA